MTDTTRPDGVEQALALAVKQLEVMRLYAKLPEHEEVIYQGVLDRIVATIAALTAPASKPAGITDEQVDAVIDAVRRSIGGLAPASTNYYLHRDAAAQGIREALSHAKPAEGGVVDALRALLTLEADGLHASEASIEVWERARAALAPQGEAK